MMPRFTNSGCASSADLGPLQRFLMSLREAEIGTLSVPMLPTARLDVSGIVHHVVARGSG